MNCRIIICAFIALIVAGYPGTMRAGDSSDGANLISVRLDDVQLVDVFRMFARISGAQINYNESDLPLNKRVSINAEDQPWLPTPQYLLAPHGLAVIEETNLPDVHTIVKTDGPESAQRIRDARAVIKFAERVVSDFKNNKTDRAIARLEEEIAKRRQLIADSTPKVEVKQPLAK